MADIHTELVFGLKVKISSPLVPSKADIEPHLRRVQDKINMYLLPVIGSALKLLLPGFQIQITNAKTSFTVEKVQT